MRKRRIALIAAVAVVISVYVGNASWRVDMPPGETRLIAHRGVHQTFRRDGLDNDTCTAERIHPLEHAFIENTIPSMRAAFEAGADVVELDVHPTTDERFAVMHDWTLDCRTEGSGETRSHDMAYLKSLDVGYGYTDDDGRTFPLRGTGVGLMPELEEVLAEFPQGRFLVNFKSRESREGDMLAAMLQRRSEWRQRVWGVYGGDEPTLRAFELIDGDLKAWTRRGLVSCVARYMALGWAGYVPEACRETMVMVPVNVAPWLWGWPNLFVARLGNVGSEVILLGPYASGDPGAAGIDRMDDIERVPPAFPGYVWTNRIERIAPALRVRSGFTDG